MFPTPCPMDASDSQSMRWHMWQPMLRKKGDGDGVADFYADELVPRTGSSKDFLGAFAEGVSIYLAHIWEVRCMRQSIALFEFNKDQFTATKHTDYAAEVSARQRANLIRAWFLV